ncbi:MAG: S46 family peptidase [Bacteroidales bacterium]
MKRKGFIVFMLLYFIQHIAWSYEGMWIPLLIEKHNIKDMHKNNFRLSAEAIYSINQACLTNTVVLFGRGCTGEIISPEGLLLTNHHCGYSRIQSHSTLEKDYLTDGFWAYSKTEELPNSGLTASFLLRIEDVTSKIALPEDSALETHQRNEQRKLRIKDLIKETIDCTTCNAEIEPFFFGKEYYMFVYQTYRDVRLVGAPPSSIGKFGGDTDNWIWPRHTGDFALYRVYADSANNPADYSPGNIPYKPKNYLKISIKELNEGDFTMILGYPARTFQYLTSHELKMLTGLILPAKIKFRDAKLAIMRGAMEKNDAIRLKYASNYAGTANAWKKWIGVVKGAERFNIIEKKQAFEKEFESWANNNLVYQAKYSHLFAEFPKIYTEIEPYSVAIDYGQELIFGSELIEFVSSFVKLVNLPGFSKPEEVNNILNELKSHSVNFYKNYETSVDIKVFSTMLEMFYKNIDPRFHPGFYKTIHKKYKGDYDAYSRQIFKKSIFTDKDAVMELVSDYINTDIKKILKDPAYEILNSFGISYSGKVYPVYNALDDELKELYPVYLEAMMLMQPEKTFYPDANFTMRMTYGSIEGYSPADAVLYDSFTTLQGVMEKEDPDIYDYKVPEKLKQLYHEKDFGRYGVNGQMPLCFVASNHTSGGNSGSPVLNADGQLIGINFDRNWEGTVNDYMYDPDMCRNIALDIRYALFIIDKFAGAQNIINELTIVE